MESEVRPTGWCIERGDRGPRYRYGAAQDLFAYKCINHEIN